jgi:DNA-binding GntR family transcriptional regulator
MMGASRALAELEHGGLLADRAYAQIQGAIYDNRLPAGASLSVPELARQLAISRSPVREAVQRLVHEGLAVTVPHKGAVVARVQPEDLYQLYEVRELLEGLAVRLATHHLDQGAAGELGGIVARHREVLDGDEGLTAHIEIDMRFHRRIREIAGNPHLVRALDDLQGKIRLAMHSLWRSEDAPRLALRDHEEILAFMTGGDAGAAEAAARRHIARIRDALRGSTEPGT